MFVFFALCIAIDQLVQCGVVGQVDTVQIDTITGYLS